MNHKGTMSIITNNLIIRRISEDDNYPNININDYNRKNYYNWIITYNNNSVIGFINVIRYNDLLKTIQLNYKVNNYDLLNEILNSIFNFFFNEVSCNRIEIRTNKDKLDNYMTYEGTLRQAELINNKLSDIKLFSILKEEFKCD